MLDNLNPEKLDRVVGFKATASETAEIKAYAKKVGANNVSVWLRHIVKKEMTKGTKK